MRKVIAAINMTLDGFCDHTAITPDDEVHQHYTDLLRSGNIILYGRKTFELMEYWRTIVENPTGNKAADEFAEVMDNIQKVVFTNTLKNVDWHSARLAKNTLEETVLELKQQSGKPILVGSRSLLIQLLNSNLLDELQICVHPVLVGKGLPLFEKMDERKTFQLLETKSFSGGAQLLYYQPIRESTN